MSQDAEKPIAQEAYNKLALRYAEMIDTKAHNAYYERPATLSLLPDVSGMRVLDAGCGPGAYAEWLVERGASVVAFDANEKMVRLARERLGTKAEVLRAELGRPLDFLGDGSFDLVVAPLVLDYVRSWGPVLVELCRVLKPGGRLVFSVEHPFSKFYTYHNTGNYFETELVEWEWRGFGVPVRVPSYRRSLGETLNSLLEAGFALERILEPVPTDDFREAEPEDYEKLIKRPGFMCVRARKGVVTDLEWPDGQAAA